MLESGLTIFKVYNGYWFFGRPTAEEPRLDLRAVLRRCCPDWDIGTEPRQAGWTRGDKTGFHPYGKSQAELLADQD